MIRIVHKHTLQFSYDTHALSNIAEAGTTQAESGVPVHELIIAPSYLSATSTGYLCWISQNNSANMFTSQGLPTEFR